MRVFYFGCWGQVGHYLWLPGHHHPEGRQRLLEHDIPWQWTVDGGLAPREWDSHRAPEMPQGVARVHHARGWSALSMWDRSVDSRGNSSSTFLFESPGMTFDEMVAGAREHFPEVVARFPFEIVAES